MSDSRCRYQIRSIARRVAPGWAVVAAALALGTALPGAALAQQIETSRALITPAQIDLLQTAARKCWARYGTDGGQPRNGVITETAFRVPCPEQMTPDLIATLQRALQARGQYDGPITGHADPKTRAALQAFQRASGFDSPILTLDTAQRLGLLPIELTRK